MVEDIKGKYKHHKGGEYNVIGIAIDKTSKGNEKYIVYTDKDNKKYIRSVADFFSFVPKFSKVKIEDNSDVKTREDRILKLKKLLSVIGEFELTDKKSIAEAIRSNTECFCGMCPAREHFRCPRVASACENANPCWASIYDYIEGYHLLDIKTTSPSEKPTERCLETLEMISEYEKTQCVETPEDRAKFLRNVLMDTVIPIIGDDYEPFARAVHDTRGFCKLCPVKQYKFCVQGGGSETCWDAVKKYITGDHLKEK